MYSIPVALDFSGLNNTAGKVHYIIKTMVPQTLFSTFFFGTTLKTETKLVKVPVP
jgi:hypothetical protein